MAKITKEIVSAVKKYSERYPHMRMDEIAKLCGISAGSASNILTGKYDNVPLPSANVENEATNEATVSTSVPYSKYKKLVLCELAIGEILRGGRPATNADDCIFVDYRVISQIIKRYLPDEFNKAFSDINGR